jgi:hypothetical protein
MDLKVCEGRQALSGLKFDPAKTQIPWSGNLLFRSKLELRAS